VTVTVGKKTGTAEGNEATKKRGEDDVLRKLKASHFLVHVWRGRLRLFLRRRR
jgi:hypothetical protein